MLTEEADRVFSLLSLAIQGSLKGRGNLQAKKAKRTFEKHLIGVEYIADMLQHE